ncbi:ArsR family transcriptional regulator [Caldibacillus thermoamylovorans]|uniref:ArsR family transcriptional regulator n=1 Tax=Caldibacillus thermoamylovorans TaxID=35841 RepID=A0A090IV79_9BACI|nr:ArsR family transcriptional regulator [Caldibacillus thermoamylovorans]
MKKLEDANLITTELVPGRGTQKINTKNYDRIIIDLFETEEMEKERNCISFEMPIGQYYDCSVDPSCGLVSESNYIGFQDDPSSFYEPNRKDTQLLYFRSGYVEYRFPNRVPYGSNIVELEFSMEICSEAPYHKNDWPSDITFWINGREIGTWTSPGDFGDRRGLLTPRWWSRHFTQYGQLKNFKVTHKGCFVDGVQLSDISINDLDLIDSSFISLRIEVKKDSKNVGGINLFGPKFGDYKQGIILSVRYE